MIRISPLPAATFAVLLGLSSGIGVAVAQDKNEQPGCTTTNGVATGTGCDAANQGAGAVENGMPATKHQEEVMGTDDKAEQGQNMDATGAGGAQMPATEHQEDVLKKPDASGQSSSNQ